jgi:hypothetical protein
MTGWKRVVLAWLSAGAGLSIGFSLVWGGYLWYSARPKLPKPWNTSAIKASFDRVDTEGEKNTLVFWYTLANETEFDFRMTSEHSVHLMSKLQRQGSLAPSSEGLEKFDLPVFIPARQKLQYGIHVVYPYAERSKENSTADEKRDYRKRLTSWINQELPNLNGFAIFDDDHRYQIDFPKGW